MEPVEYAEGQGQPLDDGPREETVELQLDGVRLHFLHFEGVYYPHGDVADQKERHHLATGLGTVVLRKVDPTARNVCDEQQLQHHLEGHHKSFKIS